MTSLAPGDRCERAGILSRADLAQNLVFPLHLMGPLPVTQEPPGNRMTACVHEGMHTHMQTGTPPPTQSHPHSCHSVWLTELPTVRRASGRQNSAREGEREQLAGQGPPRPVHEPAACPAFMDGTREAV